MDGGLYQLVPLLISMVMIGVMMALSITVTRFRTEWHLIPLLASVEVFIISYTFELVAPGLEWKVALNVINYVAVMAVIVIALLIGMNVVGTSRIVVRRVTYALTALSLVMIAVIASDPWHNLYYTDVRLEPWGVFDVLAIDPGPLYMFFMSYYTAAFTITILLFTITCLRSLRTERMHFVPLIVSLSIPLATVISLSLGLIYFPTTYGLSIALVASSVILFIVDTSKDVIVLNPLSLNGMVDSLPEPVIILDHMGRVVLMNGSAKVVFPGTSVGSPSPITANDEELIDVDVGDDRRSYVLKKLDPPDSRGTLLVLRDETDSEIYMRHLESINRRMDMLASMTRHDISNLLTIINGHASFIRDDIGDRDDSLDAIVRSVHAIDDNIQFQRDLFDPSNIEAGWHPLDAVLEMGMGEVDTGCLEVRSELDRWEVFSDMLLAKVLGNLIDNAQRHSGGVVVSLRVEGGSIIVEDDGIGIPEDLKERIFEKGFGRNTGLGLYLTKSILSASGWGIHETGDPGKGACFEIIPPEGDVRRR